MIPPDKQGGLAASMLLAAFITVLWMTQEGQCRADPRMCTCWLAATEQHTMCP